MLYYIMLHFGFKGTKFRLRWIINQIWFNLFVMEQNVMCVISVGAHTRRQKLNQLPYRLAGVYNFSSTSVDYHVEIHYPVTVLEN